MIMRIGVKAVLGLALMLGGPTATWGQDAGEPAIEQPGDDFWVAFNSGDYGNAMALVAAQTRQCVATHSQGEDGDPAALAPCFLLANFASQTLLRLGEYDAAIETAAFGTRIAEAAFGTEAYATGAMYLALGSAYEMKGSFQEALPLFEKATAIAVAEDGAEHPDVAPYLGRLAAVQQQLGDFTQSLANIRTAMRITDDPELAAWFRLFEAQSLLGLGRSEEAEATARQGHGELVAMLGADNDMSLRMATLLASILAQRNQLEEAVPLLEELVEKGRASGQPPGELSDGITSLGLAYMKQGQLMKAERVFREGLALREQAFGPQSGQTALAHNNLGTSLLQQGKATDGLVHLLSALDIIKGNPDVSPDLTAVILTNTGTAVLATGAVAEAEEVLAQGRQLAITALGPRHPTTINLRLNHAVAMVLNGKGEEAEPLLRDIYTDSIAAGPVAAISSAASAISLAYQRQKAGDFPAAFDWFAKGEQAGRVAFRPGHRQRITHLAAYGGALLTGNGDVALARTLLRQAGAQVEDSIGRYTDFSEQAQQELGRFAELFDNQVVAAWRLSAAR